MPVDIYEHPVCSCDQMSSAHVCIGAKGKAHEWVQYVCLSVFTLVHRGNNQLSTAWTHAAYVDMDKAHVD